MLRFLLILCLFYSCNNKTETKVVGQSDTTIVEPKAADVDSIIARELKREEMPATISFKGNFVSAFSWKDNTGKNIILFSAVPEYKSPKIVENEDEISAELHVARYILKNDSANQTWKWKGGVSNCPFDIVSDFMKDAITITDLDRDGIAEICFQAMESCRSDVSPSGKRLILLEENTVYTLKGFMWIAQGPEQAMDITEKNVNLEKEPKLKDEWEQYSQLAGRYENEKEFAKAPAAFLNHARAQWLKFIKESFD